MLSEQRVAAGDGHSCFIAFNADVYCWGDNDEGQLGIGSFSDQNHGVKLADKATRIAAGGKHTCSEFGGQLSCWGANTLGQLGTGNVTHQSLPKSIDGVENVSSIGLGTGHSCVTATGGVWCWGDDGKGQVGDGGNIGGTALSPVLTSLSMGLWADAGAELSCGVDGGNAVSCWGHLPAIGPYPSPYEQSGLASASQVVVGDQFVCALLLDETMRCWGEGGIPSIGISPTDPGLTGVTSMSAGGEHVCALTDDGTLYCWGQNTFGQLGIGPSPAIGTPQTVVAAPYTLQVAAGQNHTCVVHTDDTVSCWGLNDKGQLGDGTYDNSNSPVTVQF